MPTRTPRFSITGQSPPPRIVTATPHYGWGWRKLREQRLDAEPLCRACTSRGLVAPAAEVDHITPKAIGGRDEWDNTQSLCVACHQQKTRLDIARIRRGF